jgi:hypothetical protein
MSEETSSAEEPIHVPASVIPALVRGVRLQATGLFRRALREGHALVLRRASTPRITQPTERLISRIAIATSSFLSFSPAR